MSKPKFQFVPVQSVEVSPATLAQYKNRLNKLVPFGFNTIQDIMAKPQDVVNAINTLVKGTDPAPEHKPTQTCLCSQCKSRASKRYFYSAVFYALADTTYTKNKNPLYDAFQLVKQNYNSH